jgi:hypothetical protein
LRRRNAFSIPGNSLSPRGARSNALAHSTGSNLAPIDYVQERVVIDLIGVRIVPSTAHRTAPDPRQRKNRSTSFTK